MIMNICGAPCCLGVDDVKNPYLPPWKRILKEASLAGYQAIELGPYGYLPIDVKQVSEELEKNGLAIVAGICLDTGHLYYSGMNPSEWLKKYADRLDYVHFAEEYYDTLQGYLELVE